MAGYYPSYQIQQLVLHNEERRARLDARRKKPSARTACPVCMPEKIAYHTVYRPKDECCDECLTAFWRAEDEIAAAKVRREASETEILAVAPRWPSLLEPRFDKVTEAPCDVIEAQFRGLLAVLTQDRQEQVRFDGTVPGRRIKPSRASLYSEGQNALVVNVPNGAGDLMDKLPDEITKAVAAIYEAGVEAGSNLIARLAAGEITVDQFDARGKEKRR